MFGLMRPDLDLLSPAQQARHRRYYCGLCHGVGVHVGHVWRGLHSYDAVFLATLVDGLVDPAHAAPASSCRCPILPVVHRGTRDPSSVALRFAVGTQLLLADQLLADKVEEGGRAARFAREVLGGPAERGRAVLAELGIEAVEIDGFERIQSAVEVEGAGLEAASEPTARALGTWFERIATLEGVPAESAADLAGLGQAIGRVIYAVDALEDLVSDAQKRSFNPLIVAGLPDPGRVEAAAEAIRADRGLIEAHLAALPLRKNRDLVQATVQGLLDRGDRAAASSLHKVRPEELVHLRSWLAQPAWVHAAAAVLTGLALWWSSMVQVAHAAPDQATQAASAIRRWFLPQTNNCPCDKACGDCGNICRGCGDGCKGCGDGCGECLDGCKSCGDGCDNCTNGCSGCCKNCETSCNTCPCG